MRSGRSRLRRRLIDGPNVERLLADHAAAERSAWPGPPWPLDPLGLFHGGLLGGHDASAAICESTISGVRRTRLQQFVVGAEADDPAVLEHDDLVGVDDGCDPLRHDDHGGIGRHVGEGVPQAGVGGDVEGRERVVEQVDLGPADERPGDGEALALAARDVRSALGDRRIEAFGHRFDEVPGLGDLEGLPHLLLGGVRLAVSEVGGDRAGEEVDLLGHEADLAPEGVGVDARARRRRRRGRGRSVASKRRGMRFTSVVLPGTGRADDGGGLAGLRREGDVAEDRMAGARVAEPDVSNSSSPCRTRFVTPSVGGTTDGSVSSTSPMRSAETDARGRSMNMNVAIITAMRIWIEVGQEGRQRADLHGAGIDPEAAEPQHGDAREVHDQHDGREDRRHPATDADRHVGQVGVGFAEPLGLDRFADERPDHPDAGDLLAQHLVDGVEAPSA